MYNFAPGASNHTSFTHPVYVLGRDRDREIGRDIWLGKGYKMVW